MSESYTMSSDNAEKGSGYSMSGNDSGCGGGMEYTMSGPGMESTKGQTAPEANTKGKVKVSKK